MKIRVTKETTFHDISKYLSPVEKYCEEKIRKNMYDDWDELTHTSKWLKKVLTSDDGTLDIYYMEEDKQIVAVIFALLDSDRLCDELKEAGISLQNDRIAQLTCFHVIESHRGKGLGGQWLKNEVLKDLHFQGIQDVYIKSSHNNALSLYDKLGVRVGNYIGVSDHQLYQRYAYIYKISL